jgi:iron complex transport system substrate-binding protein
MALLTGSNRRRTLRALLMAAAGMCRPAAILASEEDLAVTDALGRRIRLKAAPRRIVTIFSSNTEIVAALGLAERIVGIDALTQHPPEILHRPRVSGRLGFSVDAIMNTRPDLVVITPARQALHQVLVPMERLGVPTLVLMHRRVAEVLDNIATVGRLVGVAEQARTLAKGLQRRLAAVAARAQVHETSSGPRPRTLLVTGMLGNGLLLVARPGTYTADALALAGAEPALQGPTSLPQASPEAVLQADPDVLLVAGQRRALDDLLARPGFARLRALRNGRVGVVSRAEFLIPGPRTIDGIERLSGMLYPGSAPSTAQ